MGPMETTASTALQLAEQRAHTVNIFSTTTVAPRPAEDGLVTGTPL